MDHKAFKRDLLIQEILAFQQKLDQQGVVYNTYPKEELEKEFLDVELKSFLTALKEVARTPSP